MKKSNRVLKLLADHIDGKLPIIGVGGIMEGEDSADKNPLGRDRRPSVQRIDIQRSGIGQRMFEGFGAMTRSAQNAV